MDANGLEQNVVLSQLKQCRSHMLTQRKRRQKNRLICIQLRLLRTRFEIKDTWIENDFDLFFGGGVGGEEVRWKTVRTYGKILATPLKVCGGQLYLVGFCLFDCWKRGFLDPKSRNGRQTKLSIDIVVIGSELSPQSRVFVVTWWLANIRHVLCWLAIPSYVEWSNLLNVT